MVAGKVRVAMGLQNSPASQTKKQSSPKPQLPSPGSGKLGSQKTVFSRSFGVYFPRSSSQVQPKPPDVTDLLRLVEELRERESRLKTDVLEVKLLRESVAIVPVLETEISAKTSELEVAGKAIEMLGAANDRLKFELEEVKKKLEEERKESERKVKEMELEILELKKKAMECSKVDMNNVENADQSSSQRFQGLIDASVRSNVLKALKRVNSHRSTEINSANREIQRTETMELRREVENERPRHSRSNSDELAESSRPRHSRSNSDELAESTMVHLRSRIPRVPKPPPKPSLSSSPSSSTSSSGSCDVIPSPPQQPSCKSVPTPPPPAVKRTAPGPPPPPPPMKGVKSGQAKVRRVPEVVEFYHSLMRRDSRKESSGTGTTEVVASTLNSRDMIGEIENRSTHLLAIKTDVETQGEFIRFLIKEVENACFTNIEDVVLFVKWLDDELSYLVDERAVLKHFEWPEQKADALREAAFGYCDLKKLETEASLFHDDHRQQCGPALKKMQALLEKLEHGVYNLSRTRDSANSRFKGFQIPTGWMLDKGIVSQMKLASVKLAMKYMKRVSAELENVVGSPEEEELIVQGVRFAFRVHQFAGGFDVETMKAFQELREKANSCHIQCQSQQHARLVCRPSTPC